MLKCLPWSKVDSVVFNFDLLCSFTFYAFHFFYSNHLLKPISIRFHLASANYHTSQVFCWFTVKLSFVQKVLMFLI